MTQIDLPSGFSNDGIYKCSQCDGGMLCFTTDCDTAFCPMCGERNMDFGDWEEEK